MRRKSRLFSSAASMHKDDDRFERIESSTDILNGNGNFVVTDSVDFIRIKQHWNNKHRYICLIPKHLDGHIACNGFLQYK